MAAANPWDPVSAPNAAGLLLGRFLASGLVTQVCGSSDDVIKRVLTVATEGGYEEMLNVSKKSASCFVNFTRLHQITNMQAEIYQKNLEFELLKLEKDTADVVHPFFLVTEQSTLQNEDPYELISDYQDISLQEKIKVQKDQKCHILQSMNNHLEAVLKEKRSLRQRLMKPMCQENLPIEADYHRYMLYLLELAVTFIERLETHLETIRNIPHLDENLMNMSKALAKMDILVAETEELAENILKWREQQNEVSSCIPKILAEENYLHKHDIIMPPLPFNSKVHIQTINGK